MNTGNRQLGAGLAGALVSGIASAGAALAISCCAGPALFVAVGLGLSGASLFEKLAPYRFLFAFISLAVLTAAFWMLYVRKAKQCAGPPTVSSRSMRIVYWIVLSIVLVILIVPAVIDSVLLK